MRAPPDTFHLAAMAAGLDAVERATDLAGDPGAPVRADLRSLARELSLSTERAQVLRDSAAHAHTRLLRAREAMATLAEEIHRGHAHHHPPGTTWRGCVSETCERSRRLAAEVEGLPGDVAELGGDQ